MLNQMQQAEMTEYIQGLLDAMKERKANKNPEMQGKIRQAIRTYARVILQVFEESKSNKPKHQARRIYGICESLAASHNKSNQKQPILFWICGCQIKC